jgi:hypothetical protein
MCASRSLGPEPRHLCTALLRMRGCVRAAIVREDVANSPVGQEAPRPANLAASPGGGDPATEDGRSLQVLG